VSAVVQLAEPADGETAWLARRGLSWGASEIATLLVALGRRPMESLPAWAQPDARVTRQSRSVPRLIAQKAGVLPPRKRGKPAARGLALEPRLVALWAQLVARGQARGAEALAVDASTVQHAGELLPRELLPLVDRHCPRLSCTPDVWCRDVLGGLLVVDMKCSVKPYADRYEACPPHYVMQLHAQMAVCGAEGAAIVEGERWGAEWADVAGEPAGAIRTWPVERDDALIAEIREAAEEGWALVERLRAQMSALHGAQLQMEGGA